MFTLIRARARLRLASLLLAVAFSVACASGGALQHQVASYGAQATTLGLQAQQLVLSADKSGLQPNKDLTAKAMVAFGQLGGGLQKLADALRLYDTLAPALQAAETPKVEALLQEARRLARVVLLFVGNEALGQQLVTLFDNLDAIFLEITRALRPAQA